jgi:hypothetical protein
MKFGRRHTHTGRKECLHLFLLSLLLYFSRTGMREEGRSSDVVEEMRGRW